MKKKTRKSNIVVSGLLDYLTETGQTKLIPVVQEELTDLIRESRKADVIIITSYKLLTPNQQGTLKRLLNDLFKIDLPVKNIVDKNLLGGFTIKVGDWFLDASVLREIESIKHLLLS